MIWPIALSVVKVDGDLAQLVGPDEATSARVYVETGAVRVTWCGETPTAEMPQPDLNYGVGPWWKEGEWHALDSVGIELWRGVGDATLQVVWEAEHPEPKAPAGVSTRVEAQAKTRHAAAQRRRRRAG